MTLILHSQHRTLDLSKPQVMGILNLTPDSFSDGGELLRDGRVQLNAVYQRALQMQAEGAAILDIGGESTRPGAHAVSAAEEMDRVLPVIERLRELPLLLSVDTSKPEVMREAIRLGVDMVNDVKALQAEGAMDAVKNSRTLLCLMHMQGTPETMQKAPDYAQVCDEVCAFLMRRVQACEQAGIAQERLLLDPGFGFGKTLAHNLTLLKNLNKLQQTLGLPLLVGLSRKSMLGAISGESRQSERLGESLAAALLAVQRGARIVRVHDVKPTVAALQILDAVAQTSS